MEKTYSESIEQHCKLADKRLEHRYGLIVDTLFHNFGKSIPQSFVKRSQVKATYNFFSHPHISYEMLIATERERLMYKLSQAPVEVVLAIQDTTDANYTGSRSDGDLDCMRTEQTKGFYVHNHVLFTPQGIGLGVFDQEIWNYPANEIGTHKGQRKQQAFEEKASYRWYEQFEQLQDAFEALPSTTVISIADRESDIHELLQARRLPNVHYIIRGRGDRKEHLTNIHMKELLPQEPIIHTYEVKVPENHKDKNNKIPKRTAKVALSYRHMTIHAPRRVSNSQISVEPIELTVVYVNEIDPPKEVKEPIEWILYTSLPINDAQDALQVVEYYKCRWLIEIFHYVLKQGAQVEKLQLATSKALQNAIVTYSIVALQVQTLRYAANEYAQEPLQNIHNLHLSAQDYALLATFLNHAYKTKHDIDKKEPTVEDFFKLIAQLGGFQFQKNKSPGVKVIWRGWQQWNIIKQTAFAIRRN